MCRAVGRTKFISNPPSQRKQLALRNLALLVVKGTSSAAIRGSSSPDGATSYANTVKRLVSAENGEKGLTGNTFTPMDLSYIKSVTENGRVKVMPPSEVAAIGCEEWKKTLIWYFVGQKLHFPVVNSIAHRIWGKLSKD